jgi:hypothetical protein
MSTIVGQFSHGPLVAQGSHHVTYSRAAYVMRGVASVDGEISEVTATKAGGSAGVCAASLAVVEAHADASGNLALNLNTGWVLPPQPMPLSITVGNTCAEHTQTVTYVNEFGATVSDTISFEATTAATKTTASACARPISVTSNVAPASVVEFDWVATTPGDRYDVKCEVLRGGRVSGSPQQPRIRYSLDGGQTWSRRVDVPTTGIVDVATYAAGLVAQPTSVRLTFSGDENAYYEIVGAVRVEGTGANSDIQYTGLVPGVTVEHIVSGNNTAFSIAVSGTDITIRSATNGGGTATTTALACAAAINAHASAKLLVFAKAEGSGAGTIADIGPLALEGGVFRLSTLVEGVRYRVVAGTALAVSVSGKDVTVTVATDAGGLITSTNANVAELLEENAAAAALLTVEWDSGTNIHPLRG